MVLPSMRLDGKVAIITGGTSGIGRRTVEVFAREKASVLIAARREKEKKEREARKMAILSLKIDGILFNPKGDSTAIIANKPYKTGDILQILGTEIRIKSIENNAVLFEDTKSSDTYRVPISR